MRKYRHETFSGKPTFTVKYRAIEIHANLGLA